MKVQYITDSSTGLEVISLENVNTVYPPYTHTKHYVLGIVTEGKISILIDSPLVGMNSINSKIFYCRKYEYFLISPDVCHSIKPESSQYSMITTCIPVNDELPKSLDIIRRKIIGSPELEFCITDMAEEVFVSKYHFIRKFSSENGITPHKFQLQCRIRKAQKLLAAGKKVTEVAQDCGFFDQSHFDREFKKMLGISPEIYAKNVKSAILYKV